MFLSSTNKLSQNNPFGVGLSKSHKYMSINSPQMDLKDFASDLFIWNPCMVIQTHVASQSARRFHPARHRSLESLQSVKRAELNALPARAYEI